MYKSDNYSISSLSIVRFLISAIQKYVVESLYDLNLIDSLADEFEHIFHVLLK